MRIKWGEWVLVAGMVSILESQGIKHGAYAGVCCLSVSNKGAVGLTGRYCVNYSPFALPDTHTRRHTCTRTQSLLWPSLCFERLASVGHIAWTPLLSGFPLDLVNGWHHQETAGWKEREVRVFIPLPASLQFWQWLHWKMGALLSSPSSKSPGSLWSPVSLPPLTPLCKPRQLPNVASPWVGHDPCWFPSPCSCFFK